MKNDLKSLNDYLFEELERLNDNETLNEDDNLEKEIKRSKAITQISNQIVQNAKVILDAKKHCDQFGDTIDSFYALSDEKKKIATNPFKEFGEEQSQKNNKISKEEFKDKLIFEMDKSRL